MSGNCYCSRFPGKFNIKILIFFMIILNNENYFPKLSHKCYC